MSFTSIRKKGKGGKTKPVVWARILYSVENLLLDAKEILQPNKGFSGRVLKSHRLIYRSLLERNPEKAREEMIKHVEEVARDLIALQKETGSRVLGLRFAG